MLSTTTMVRVRKAIESTYNCTCNIVEHGKVKKENKSTGFADKIVLENKKCKLSFESITSTNQNDVSAKVTQVTKLFIAPEIDIKPGSRIDVKNAQGVTTAYESSGQPAKYESHQEIILKLFEGWA